MRQRKNNMASLRRRQVSKATAKDGSAVDSSTNASCSETNGPTAESVADDTSQLHPRHLPPSSIQGGGGEDNTARRSPTSSTSPSSSDSSKSDKDSSNDKELAHIDLHFRYVSMFGAMCYIILVAFGYYMTPPENIRYLKGYEKSAPLLAFLILVVSCTTHVLPLFYKRSSTTTTVPSNKTNGRRSTNTISGVLIGALMVQCVACISDAMMAFGKTPILTDPILGTRVYLMRWCEWTPLAFVMTFLTEGCAIHHHPQDSNKNRKELLKPSYFNASCQGLSTLCGVFFPFCKTIAGTKYYVPLWTVLMIISCALFSVIFPRCVCQWKEFRRVQEQFDTMHVLQKQTQTRLQENGEKVAALSSTAPTVDEMEVYDRSRLSLRLLFTCATMWSMLVLSYFISGCFSLYKKHFDVDSDSIWFDPALTMFMECTMDVLAKVLYLHIIVDVHEAVFDEGVKAERRLEELRKMMSVVWENSSDVIAISVRGGIKGDVTTMVSPTYLQIYNQSLMEDVSKVQNDEHAKSRALVFELDATCFRVDQKTQQNPSTDMGYGMESISKGEGGIEVQPPIAPMSVHPRAVYDTEFCSLPSLNQQHNETGENAPSIGGSRRDSMASISSNRSLNDDDLRRTGHKSIRQEEISSMADLVVRAWTHEGGTEALLMHDLIRRGSNDNPSVQTNNQNVQDEALKFDTIRCEAKINRLQENALVIVVRDISERFRRFEAEKRVVFETTAREKDAEANRFTRHEVKNGLLAAIGLCEGLKETMIECGSFSDNSVMSNRSLLMAEPSTSNALSSSSSHHHLPLNAMVDTSSRLIIELDKTLREVLDTILAEAMARDVIHEVYEPRSERVDICELLCGISATQGYRDVINTDYSGNRRSERFPLIVHPSPLPHLSFDPQLLRYIHRNAVSNACKYGQRGGVVLTEVIYDDTKRMVHMAVINLPGEHHEKLLAMGNDVASDIVFSPGQRLHRHFEKEKKNRNGGGTEVSHSSGDGAWIMQKCAKTLSGDCSIKFESSRTVFSLSFPALPYDVTIRAHKTLDPTQFRLPQNIWGIAIDDSKIQRKLMERYFGMVGIKKDRTIVLGKDANEISGFADYVVDFIEKRHKVEGENDYYLIIADENLDIMEDETHYVTVSGSLCVESIRRRLLPDQERQMCALIRSANDSSQDVAIYNSRAHGFLPKVPIKRDRVMETLAPLWEHRYPPNHTASSGTSASSRFFRPYGEDLGGEAGMSNSNDRREEPSTRTNQGGSLALAANTSFDSSDDSKDIASSKNKKTMGKKNSESDDDSRDSDDNDDKISIADLMQTVHEIDALCTVEGKDGGKHPPEELWLLVWEKLHSLKGDLQTMYNSASVVNKIKSLRGPVLPENFVECWKDIRALVMAMN